MLNRLSTHSNHHSRLFCSISSIILGLLVYWQVSNQLTQPAFAQTATENYEKHPLAQQLISEMVTEHKFDKKELTKLFAQAERKQVILDAISRPAEKSKTWKEYRPIFINKKRINSGKKFWKDNKKTLLKAEKKFGVPAEIIVAIIGVETHYGHNKGKFRVIDALSTLAFDYPPRAKFFRQQLKEFLLMTKEEKLDPTKLTGSYAGAMGYPQFMPSSFRQYAIDFDKNGKIDFWDNPNDAIGSIANYLINYGWETKLPITGPATTKGKKYNEYLNQGLKPTKTIQELKKLGFNSKNKFNPSLKNDMLATAMLFEGEKGKEYWLGLYNFYVITRYNHSRLYAMSVYQLSQEIK